MEGKRAYYHGYKSKKVIILNVYFCDMYNGMYMFVYCLYNFLNCKTNFFGVHSENIQKLKKFIMTIFTFKHSLILQKKALGVRSLENVKGVSKEKDLFV